MTLQPHRPLARHGLAAPLERLRHGGAGGWSVLTRLLSARLPVVRFDPDRRVLLLPQGAPQRPAEHGGRRQGVELRLPAGAVLRKSVRLPAAAAENLRNLLALEMDRETPFPAQSVWFGYRVGRRDRAFLAIDLVVVPRSLFEDCMTRLAALGLAARCIAIEPAEGDTLVRFPVEGEVASWRNRAAPILLGAVLLLALVTNALDLLRAGRIETELAAARAQSERVLALKRSLATGDAQGAGEASRAAILAALADALPDGTWLDRLSIDGRSLEISGFAPDAAALLVRLAQSSPFQDAHFLGATVREAKTQRDHFQIALTLREVKP